jgi:hypothetical protein
MRSPIRWRSQALHAPAESPEKWVKGSEFGAPAEDLFESDKGFVIPVAWLLVREKSA